MTPPTSALPTLPMSTHDACCTYYPQEFLGKARSLVDQHQLDDAAAGKVLLALANFYERQHDILSTETTSSSFERLR